MTLNEIIQAQNLPEVFLSYIRENEDFKNISKKQIQEIALDIESASVNPNCTCIGKVKKYVINNTANIGNLIYNYINEHEDIKELVENLFKTLGSQSIVGKVATTNIKDWGSFIKNLNDSGYHYNHISTSVLGDIVYVFFA